MSPWTALGWLLVAITGVTLVLLVVLILAAAAANWRDR